MGLEYTVAHFCTATESHIPTHVKEGFLVCVPKVFPANLGTEIPLSGLLLRLCTTAPADCPPLLPACFWAPTLPLCLFSTCIPAQNKLNKAPHPDLLNSWATLRLSLFWARTCAELSPVAQKRRVVVKNLPFSTRLNPTYNKTLSKDVTTSQPHVCACACAVRGKEFAEEMAIFPWISSWRGATIRTRTQAVPFLWELH